MSGGDALDPVTMAYLLRFPADAAKVLGADDARCLALCRALAPEVAAPLVGHLAEAARQRLLGNIDDDLLLRWLNVPGCPAALVASLERGRRVTLAELAMARGERVGSLHHPPDTAGGLAERPRMSANSDETCQALRDRLTHAGDRDPLIHVCDPAGGYLGVLGIAGLLADGQERVGDFVMPHGAVPASTPLGALAGPNLWQGERELAVVDGRGQLVGVLSRDAIGGRLAARNQEGIVEETLDRFITAGSELTRRLLAAER